MKDVLAFAKAHKLMVAIGIGAVFFLILGVAIGR